jgi:hypothetical protein
LAVSFAKREISFTAKQEEPPEPLKSFLLLRAASQTLEEEFSSEGAEQ